MTSVTKKLADFAVAARFEDIPEAVVHESKRILLDSVGCALAALATDKGKLAVKLAKRLGGTHESTIIGTGDRVSCANASFANGELINALDYEPLPHVAPYVIPAPLALAETVRASGKDLLLAIAVGYEIGTRMLSALMTDAREFVKEGPEKGKVVWPPVRGYAPTIFGGTAAAAKMLGLDSNEMAHALGIAGHICPVPANVKWVETTPCSLTKYLSAGWLDEAEVTSALLAQMGCSGDTTVLDGEFGFWRFFSSSKWEPNLLTDRLGEEWHLLQTSYKPYPCCGIMTSPLDCFVKIMDGNNLLPADVKKVRVWLDPLCERPVWSNREITNHVDAQFSVAFVFAVAAHRVRVGADWQALDTIKNPRILDFMKKVEVAAHPEAGRMALGSPGMNYRLAGVEVVAKGRTFKEEKTYGRGSFVPEEARLKDEELAQKFEENAAPVLPSHRIDAAVKCILELESIGDVSQLIKEVTL